MVKRYEPCCCSKEWETGDYVHYDDYAALLAENEGLKAELIALDRYGEFIKYAIRSIREEGGEVNNAVSNKLSGLLDLIDAHTGE